MNFMPNIKKKRNTKQFDKYNDPFYKKTFEDFLKFYNSPAVTAPKPEEYGKLDTPFDRFAENTAKTTSRNLAEVLPMRISKLTSKHFVNKSKPTSTVTKSQLNSQNELNNVVNLSQSAVSGMSSNFTLPSQFYSPLTGEHTEAGNTQSLLGFNKDNLNANLTQDNQISITDFFENSQIYKETEKEPPAKRVRLDDLGKTIDIYQNDSTVKTSMNTNLSRDYFKSVFEDKSKSSESQRNDDDMMFGFSYDNRIIGTDDIKNLTDKYGLLNQSSSVEVSATDHDLNTWKIATALHSSASNYSFMKRSATGFPNDVQKGYYEIFDPKVTRTLQPDINNIEITRNNSIEINRISGSIINNQQNTETTEIKLGRMKYPFMKQEEYDFLNDVFESGISDDDDNRINYTSSKTLIDVMKSFTRKEDEEPVNSILTGPSYNFFKSVFDGNKDWLPRTSNIEESSDFVGFRYSQGNKYERLTNCCRTKDDSEINTNSCMDKTSIGINASCSTAMENKDLSKVGQEFFDKLMKNINKNALCKPIEKIDEVSVNNLQKDHEHVLDDKDNEDDIDVVIGSCMTTSLMNYKELKEKDIIDFSMGGKFRESSLNDTTLDCQFIMVLSEGRGYARGEIGVAVYNLDSPALILSQFSDNLWYTGLMIMLSIYRPNEIILPTTMVKGNPQPKMIKYIKFNFPQLIITPVQRKHFNSVDGFNLIDEYCSVQNDSLKQMIQNKYYALASACAMLKYLQFVKVIKFASKTLQMIYETKYGCMMIDMDTSNRLELLFPYCATKEKKCCLYGILNSCVTQIGKRMLRAKILQPYSDIKQIKIIQDCIKELIRNCQVQVKLELCLKQLHRVDQLNKLSITIPQEDNVKAAESLINNMISLKTCIDQVPVLRKILQGMSSEIMKDAFEKLCDKRYRFIMDEILKIINPEVFVSKSATKNFHRLFTVRSGIHELLDLVRKRYTELIDEVLKLIEKYGFDHNVSMRMNHTNSRGFHIIAMADKKSELPDLPSLFEVIQKKKNIMLLTTSEIDRYNIRLKNVIEEIYLLSNSVLGELLHKIRAEIEVIYNLTGIVGDLDVIQSYAKLSSCPDYCCPTFGDETRVVGAVHPLLEHNRIKRIPVPNNFIGLPESNFFIITGPNMGGKSVYIKMIAIHQIMAQLGCFVPAKSASFRICDKLFSRVGFDDDIVHGLSSFTLEMKQMEYIIKNLTPNSVVIIDELCRNTNAEEGEMLAWEFSTYMIRLFGKKNSGEYFKEPKGNQDGNQTENTDCSALSGLKLTEISSPFIYLTTHFQKLTRLADVYLNVSNLRFLADEIKKDNRISLSYKYEVETGANVLKRYGINLAKTTIFPIKIIPRAEEILDVIETEETEIIIKSTAQGKESVQNETSMDVRKILYSFYGDFKQMILKNDIPNHIRGYFLNDLLKNFVEEASDELINYLNDTFSSPNLEQLLADSKNLSRDEDAIINSLEEIQLEENTLPWSNESLSQNTWHKLDQIIETFTQDNSNNTFNGKISELNSSNDEVNNTFTLRQSRITEITYKSNDGNIITEKPHTC